MSIDESNAHLLGVWKHCRNSPKHVQPRLPYILCPRTQALGLAHNELERVPKDLGSLRALRELDLRHNELLALPHTTGQLAQLENLAASGRNGNAAAETQRLW